MFHGGSGAVPCLFVFYGMESCLLRTKSSIQLRRHMSMLEVLVLLKQYNGLNVMEPD